MGDLLHPTPLPSNASKTSILEARQRKYISCNFQENGGLGNQIWRFASIYGIGRHTNREPFFEATNLEQMQNLKEIGLIFPTMSEVLQIKSPPDVSLRRFYFAHDCCKFDYPKKLVFLVILLIELLITDSLTCLTSTSKFLGTICNLTNSSMSSETRLELFLSVD